MVQMRCLACLGMSSHVLACLRTSASSAHGILAHLRMSSHNDFARHLCTPSNVFAVFKRLGTSLPGIFARHLRTSLHARVYTPLHAFARLACQHTPSHDVFAHFVNASWDFSQVIAPRVQTSSHQVFASYLCATSLHSHVFAPRLRTS